ncbi:MAG: hypothetical protein UU47_C0003G0037 [candidate division TM6 bacterium GW2011_GWE2_41_16]|nr:MAG: hypothetical protein UU47_C0003G0037 [candidate division TM6 bacterium GW2011_GWE2_41_16]
MARIGRSIPIVQIAQWTGQKLAHGGISFIQTYKWAFIAGTVLGALNLELKENPQTTIYCWKHGGEGNKMNKLRLGLFCARTYVYPIPVVSSLFCTTILPLYWLDGKVFHLYSLQKTMAFKKVSYEMAKNSLWWVLFVIAFNLSDWHLNCEKISKKIQLNKNSDFKVLQLTSEDRKLSGIALNNVIKKQYRKLSLTYHPDKHMSDSKKQQEINKLKFEKLQQAYARLQKEYHIDEIIEVEEDKKTNNNTPKPVVSDNTSEID